MNAVESLQTKIGVTPDGDIGPKTLKAIQAYWKLTPGMTAMFMGNVAHESGNFKVFAENLNYSSTGLIKTFPKYFDLASSISYQRQPQRIANRVYANRMGNGNELSGDGWKYRGRGAIQLTGKTNYTLFAGSLTNTEILKNPDIVATDLAFESAKWFFDHNQLWSICNSVNDISITALRKRVNGGTNGLDDVKQYTKKYWDWLN